MTTLSDAQIASKAMALLGQNPITDLSDTSVPNAVKVNQVYASERDSLLREYSWNFATGRQSLALSTYTPPFYWQYAFQVPSDFIRARMVNGNVSSADGISGDGWVLEGLYILTNGSGGDVNPASGPTSTQAAVAPVCNLVYTKRITQTGLFDDLFAECLGIKIAAILAMPITKDPKKQMAMLKLLALRMPTAKAANANESGRKNRPQYEEASWISSRGGCSGYDGEYR